MTQIHNRAPTVREIGHLGKDRLRCSLCGKVAYNTQLDAELAALRISERVPMRAYFKSKCGWYHVSRQRSRRDRRPVEAPAPMKPRDYQEHAIESIFRYFEEKSGNPLVAMPTGTGKSLVIGEFCKRALCRYPGTRIMMLTHVKELIAQNMKNLLAVWPSAPAGIYSAGLKRRDHRFPITFAGIQSIYKKPELFGEVHLVLIDEAHLLSPKDNSRYQLFLDELKKVNPHLKVVGFTATAFRLGQGMLTDGEKAIFTDICFDASSMEGFNWLLDQGWLARLVPKQPNYEIDVRGVKIQAGEFNLDELQERVDKTDITMAALKEAVTLAADRKHWLVFATGIQHAEHVADFLETEFGVSATCVHSKMPNEERDRRLRDFKAGKIRAMVNNNILTTGFDYPDIDCIVMLRPTNSPVLWVQMLGRGTRPVFPPGFDQNNSTAEERLAAIKASEKPNCLVLDFAGNTRRLGPINDPVIPRPKRKGPPGIAPVRLCDECGCYSHASARFCENCGAEFPRSVKIEMAASTHELITRGMPTIEDLKKKLPPPPGTKPIPMNTFKVDLVTYRLHKKVGKPDSMRVEYHCGIRKFSEYIALDHGGFAAKKAQMWWRVRIPQEWQGQIPPSVHAGMEAVSFLRVPTEIKVMEPPHGYPEICGYTFGEN